jgi:hypothetical protein
MLLAGVVFAPANAADYSWNSGTATGGSGLWVTPSLWTPGSGPPTNAGDTAFITNFIAGANRTVTIDTSFTITDLTASSVTNNTLQRIITLNNGLTLQLTGNTILGSNTVFNIGNNTTGSSTLSNNNLTLRDNGTITLFGNSIANLSTLVVAGVFSNSSTSTIEGASGLGRLHFSDTGITTNRGAMNFIISSAAAAGQTGLVLRAATFHNSGTVNLGITGNTTARQSVFSNLFVNAGLLVLTNNSSNAGGSYSFTVTGGTVTNLATGTLRFVADGAGTGVRNVATLTGGGFVNLGTLTFLQTGGTAGNNNDLVLTDGSTFSNALGGQLIVATGNIGNIRVLANRSLNLGTNLVQAGTLHFLTAAGGNGFLDNAGVIQLDNANLVAAGNLTNLANGLIRVGVGNTGTLVNRVVNNPGGSLVANGGTLVLSVTPDQRGDILVTNTGTLQLGTGTLAWTNTGTLFLHGGTVLSGNLTNSGGGTIRGSGTINSFLVNLNGTLTATNGTLTLGSVSNAANGIIRLRDNGTLDVAGFANLGRIEFHGGNLASGVITNTSGAQINSLAGTGTFTSGRVLNQAGGSINATNGTLIFNGGLTNASGGHILISNATLQVGDWANVGNVTNQLLGTLAAGTTTNTGLIESFGALNSHVVNAGNLNLQAGSVTGTITNSGTLRVTNDAVTLTGFVNNTGNLELRSTGSLTGGTVTNSGTIATFAGGRVESLLVNRAAGTIQATNGTLTLGSVTNAGLVNIHAATVTGTVAWVSTGTLNFLTNGVLQGGALTNAGILNGAVGGLSEARIINTSSGTINATNLALNLAGGLINQGIVRIDASSTNVIGTVFDNSGGTVRLNNSGGTLTPAVLIISNQFLSDASGVITNTGGGAWRITFAGNQTTVTNAGLMDLRNTTGGAAGNTMGTLSYGGPVIASTNFVNTGTLIVGIGAAQLNRGFAVEGFARLRNEGSLVVSNDTSNTTAANAATLTFNSLGNQVHTNSATGVIALKGLGSGGRPANLEITTGRFLNEGLILSEINSASTNMFRNTAASAQAGFVNAGVIQVTGGALRLGMGAGLFTNTATGRILVENGVLHLAQGTVATGGDGRRVNNFGTVTLSSGATLSQGTAATTPNFALVINNSGATLQVTNGTGVLNSRFYSVDNQAGASVNVSNGTLRLLSGFQSQAGTITVRAGGLLDVQGNDGTNTVNNSGTVRLLATAANTATITSGSVTNLAGGAITGAGIWTTDRLVNEVGGVITANIAGASVAGLRFDTGATVANFGTLAVANGGTLIFGAASGTAIVTNAGAIALINGTFRSGDLTNTAGGVVRGSGIGTLTGRLINQVGGVVTSHNARLIFNNVVTNAGTFKMFNSIGTFNAAVVNSGAWIVDPTTNVFHSTLTVTTSGSISASAGDVFVFREDFINQSSQTLTWNTRSTSLNNFTNGVANLGAIFQFAGDGVTTQQFFHAGLTLTGGFLGLASTATETQMVSSFGAVVGFNNNFALGTLELTNTILKLSDTFGTVSPDDALTGGLFVKNLFLYQGAELIISNNMRVYFINSNDWATAGATVTLLGNAELHQLIPESLAVVPEPSVLLFLLTGGAILAARRRRRAASESVVGN